MELFGAITGGLGLALSVALALIELTRRARASQRAQVNAVSMTAEFVGFDGNQPVCRVVCHNRSDHAINHVHAYVRWKGVTEWAGGDAAPSWCTDVVGFYGVGPNERTERVVTMEGRVVERPQLVPGPFPVRFTMTDASRRRWERTVTGKVKQNPTLDVLAPGTPDEGPI